MARINIEDEFDPQMAAALRKQAELAPDLGNLTREPDPERMRESYRTERMYWNAGGPAVASVRNLSVASKAGAVPIRVYHPEPGRVLPVLVYSHGGGCVVGDNDTHDRIMRVLATRAGMAVVGVDYHLSPEYKFPTPLEDLEAVVLFLIEKGASLSLDPDKLGLGGDSAGAFISLGTCFKLRPSLPGRVKHLQLIYGSFGLKDSISRRLYGGAEDGCGPEDLAYYQRCYFRSEADMADPLADLLKNDMAGLPPTLIIAAGLDPLQDDSTALYRLMTDARVPVAYKRYEGVLHGFLHLSRMVDQADQALSDCAAHMCKWLR